MKTKNMYTCFLFSIGIFYLIWILFQLDNLQMELALPVLLMIIILDFFPVRLLTGDQYSGGIIGFIILLLMCGVQEAVLGVIISALVYYLKSKSFRLSRIPWFQLLSTIGMYGICMSLSALAVGYLDVSPVILALVGVLVFEIVNIMLIGGILKTVYGLPFYRNMGNKLMEILIPTGLCVMVVPHFIGVTDVFHIFNEVVFTLFFLGIILFFSHGYLKQAGLRKKSAAEFVRLLELRLPEEMEGHGSRVGRICEELLEALSYPKNKRGRVIEAALFHDIGKALLPATIFHKKSALSLSEETEYQSHTSKGADIIRAFTNDSLAAEWVMHHHERYDGKGYPAGMKRDAIPFESRILSLCDTLDHLMLTHRDDQQVYTKLKEYSGKALDPELVGHCELGFIQTLRAGLNYAEPELKDGTSAVDYEAESVKESSGYIGKTFMLKYHDGRLTEVDEDIPLEEIARMALIAVDNRKSFHEIITYKSFNYECHFYFEEHEVRIFLIDITPIIGFREKLYSSTLQSYQDIVSTLSNGKIGICLNHNALEQQLGDLLGQMAVKEKGDVPLSRSFITEFIQSYQDTRKLMHIKLAVTEGVTNMIKHAYEGMMSVYRKEGLLQVLIADHGSGIPIHELPKTILVSGYSSKRSMGRGFTLMCSSADRVLIHTSPKGTSLLLEFSLGNDSETQPDGPAIKQNVS